MANVVAEVGLRCNEQEGAAGNVLNPMSLSQLAAHLRHEDEFMNREH